MKVMKIVVPVCLFLMTTCFAAENATTELEQQLKVQKREKQYLIEDDPNEGPEQKRDERQSTPVKNNQNVDSKGNSRIINVRMQPAPNILTASKQAIKPNVLQKPINGRIDTAPQRIPTKIPVILKTANVIPGPAHALRLKMLENQIIESKSNLNKENTLCPNTVAPPNLLKDSLPYFTIEDKATRKTESRSSPNNIDDEIPNLEINGTLNRDGKETTGNDENNPLNKHSNDSLNEGKDDQVTSNSDKKASIHKNKENSDTSSETVQNPVHFFVDEPEPLPPSIRRQQKSENTYPKNKEDAPNKIKEISIVKKGNNKPKKDKPIKKDNENDDEANDPDIVRISNGTHLLSIKKIQNHDRYKIERLVSRDGEENTVPTEERIISQEPPKPKPAADEPEKHSFSITEKSNTGKQKNVGLTGVAFSDNKNKEEKGQNDCITITNHNYEEFEEKSPISPPVTLQPADPPTLSEGNQESFNLQNPYYQNIYDQYRRNYGLAQSTPNIYGQDTVDPSNCGVQINPYIYSQPNIDPYASVITLPYYPNGNPPTDTDSTQYPYIANAYENQPEVNYMPCLLHPEIRPENTLDRIWRTWKDVEIKIRKAQSNDTEEPLDIDIRRNLDGKLDGNKVDMIGKVVNPYATSFVPINMNGALTYPYVNPGYRYMH